MNEISVKSVINATIELFGGDVNSAMRWLYQPAASLGGKTPISLLDTPGGVQTVLHLIGKLEHGVII